MYLLEESAHFRQVWWLNKNKCIHSCVESMIFIFVLLTWLHQCDSMQFDETMYISFGRYYDDVRDDCICVRAFCKPEHSFHFTLRSWSWWSNATDILAGHSIAQANAKYQIFQYIWNFIGPMCAILVFRLMTFIIKQPSTNAPCNVFRNELLWADCISLNRKQSSTGKISLARSQSDKTDDIESINSIHNIGISMRLWQMSYWTVQP